MVRLRPRPLLRRSKSPATFVHICVFDSLSLSRTVFAVCYLVEVFVTVASICYANEKNSLSLSLSLVPSVVSCISKLALDLEVVDVTRRVAYDTCTCTYLYLSLSFSRV